MPDQRFPWSRTFSLGFDFFGISIIWPIFNSLVPPIKNLRQVAAGADRSGLCLLGAIFAWFVGWNAMEAFFTLYARNTLGIREGTGAQMLTAFAAFLILFAIPHFASSASAIVGPILAGMLMDRVGYNTIWLLSALFIGLAAVLMSRVQARARVSAAVIA